MVTSTTYKTREEAEDIFNLFLADEAMDFQDMLVQALPTQGIALFKLWMCKLYLFKLWLLKQCLISTDRGLEISSLLYYWW
jgi:hypothetical protein